MMSGYKLGDNACKILTAVPAGLKRDRAVRIMHRRERRRNKTGMFAAKSVVVSVAFRNGPTPVEPLDAT
jgi:hypothetical protein